MKTTPRSLDLPQIIALRKTMIGHANHFMVAVCDLAIQGKYQFEPGIYKVYPDELQRLEQMTKLEAIVLVVQTINDEEEKHVANVVR